MVAPSVTPAGVANSAFLARLSQGLPNGVSLWVTNFVGNPDITDAQNWAGKAYNPGIHGAQVDGWAEFNTYFSVAALRPTADGRVSRTKNCFSRLAALVVDDAQLDDVLGQVSYVLQTSPGKQQIGIFLDPTDPDCSNRDLTERVINEMANRGLIRVDASGNNVVRYVRLPLGQNQKPRAGGNWAHQMAVWAPDVVLTLDEAAAAFGVDLQSLRSAVAVQAQGSSAQKLPQDERLRLLSQNIVRAERLHESINEFAASMLATGTAPGSVVNVLRGLMEASPVAKDERWMARYNDIPRSVSTAQEKYARPAFGASVGAELAASVDGFKLKRSVVDFTKLRPIKWVLGGFIAAGEVVVWAGQPGVGKSTVFAGMAALVAGFGPLLGSDIENDRPRRVVIVSEHAGQYERLFHGFTVRYGIDAALLMDMVHLFDAARMTAAEIGREVGHLISEHQGDDPPLIMLDTASASFDVADENSNAEVGALMAALKPAVTESGAPLWIIAHAAKALGREDSEITPRGASAYIGDAHGTGSVFRDKNFPDSTFLKSLKNRNEREFSEIEVRTEVAWHEVTDERGVIQRIGIRTGVPMKALGVRAAAASEAAEGAAAADAVVKTSQDKRVALQSALVSALLASSSRTKRMPELVSELEKQGYKKTPIYDMVDRMSEDKPGQPALLSKTRGVIYLLGKRSVE